MGVLLEDSYICDGNGTRTQRCDNYESHHADMSGGGDMAIDAGANEKFRQTKEDDRVRDEHRQDSEAGWIPIDEAYEFSGETISGDSSFGCRCVDLYRISE